jgi:lipoprotein-anchoring transpeptidase ErfK/SrfK
VQLAAVLAAAALVVSACGSDKVAPNTTQTVVHTAGQSGSATSSSPSAKPTHTKPPKPKKPVHVSLKFGDGQTLGVGMPIIAFLSRPITDATGFAKATKVTVDGRVVHGGWYFERKYGDPGHPIEADYRLQHYWPAHARIHLDLPVKGVSAGKGLAFSDDLTLDFATGDARIVTVDAATHKLSVTDDGKPWGTFPVSLGADATRTRRGIKVIMEKYPTTCMHDTAGSYYECGIKLDQRLTYDGEYLHSAPWNVYNIEHGVDSSNGCTNLLPADAQKLYDFLDVGDPVQYPNANGALMQIGDGYGDWNVSWPQWQLGGLYRTS